MVPCIQITDTNGQNQNIPVFDIRHIQEDSDYVRIIRITRREAVPVQEDFDTIVEKCNYDLVPFTDANASGRRTAVNRFYVARVLSLSDGTCIIVLKTEQNFYPVETYAVMSPLFEETGPGGAGTGDVTNAGNIGGGIGLFDNKNGSVLEFKTLVDGNNSQVVNNGDGTIQIDVDASGFTRTTFSLLGLTMIVKHTSGLLPALVNVGDGDWRLVVQTGTKLFDIIVLGGSSTINSGTSALTLRIDDADGHYYRLIVDYWISATKSRVNNPADAGLTVSYTEAGNERAYVFQNMGWFGGDFELNLLTL